MGLALVSPAAAQMGATLEQPDFQLTFAPSSQTLQPGAAVSFAIGVGTIGGFSDPVSLSVSGLPSGVTASFAPDTVTPPGTSFLTLRAAADAATGTFNLTVTATGGGITHIATGQATVDFGLVPLCYGKLHGVVTNSETGAPIAGAKVDDGDGNDVTTAADGSYDFTQVQLGENNSPVDVTVTGADDPPLFANIGTYWSESDHAVVLCGKTTEIDLALVPVHPAFLFGQVVVGNPDPLDYSNVIPTSTPIEGANVGLEFLAAPFTTGADGRYELSFHVGENNTPLEPALFAFSPDAPNRHGYWSRTLQVPQIGPGDHHTFDVALVKQCTASLAAHVVYGDTGLPAAGVQIDTGNGAGTDGVSGTTDQNGDFSVPELLLGVNNAPTTFGASALADGYQETNDTSPIMSCGGHADLSIVLQPIAYFYGAIQGHVYDQDGLPVSGAGISVFCSSAPKSTCATTTDATGFYSLPHVPVSSDPSTTTATYATQANRDGYYGDGGTVDVDVGATTTKDFHLLLQRFGRIAGVVRDQITHTPIADAVELGFCGGPRTAADGSYTTPPLSLAYPNADTQTGCRWVAGGYWFKDVSATISADHTTPLDVDLLPICQGATIAGTVVDAATGLPIANASVSGGNQAATTDGSGHYALTNVQVGYGNSPLDTQVTASAPGYYTAQKTVTVFCGGSIVLDFGRPEPPGHIVVVERTTPTGSTQSFDFTRNWGEGFSLADGQSFDSGDLTPATGYSVEQKLPLPDGWVRTGATCSDGSPPTNVALSAGETVTCTFTDSFGPPPPAIVHVVKSCPAGRAAAGDRFQITLGGTAVGDPIACGGSADVTVTAGASYAIGETAAGSTNLSNYDQHLSSGCSGTLAAGAHADCTITNTVRTGTIVVLKRTLPAGDPATFAFTGDAAGTIADGQKISVSSLPPGTYTSTESVPAGWELASISCDDGGSPSPSSGAVASAKATFNVDPGETVTCTFTDDKRGTIVVSKQTQPTGAAGSFTFAGDAAGSIGSGGSIVVGGLSTVGSPTYHSTEADPTPGFDLTAIACDDQGSAHASSGDINARTATFRLDPGETVTCTFTNTQRGTISVRKTVGGSALTSALPSNQQSFTFQLRVGASTTNAGSLLAQADANVANGGGVSFANKLVAGSMYQLCEQVLPGWQPSFTAPFVLYNASGDNSTLCSNVSVAAGESKTIAVDNRPPPGGLALTIGFWKNWASCANSNGHQKPALDQALAAAGTAGITIGTLTLHGSTSNPNVAPDCLKATRLLDKSTIDTGKKMASDPAFDLAAQLLAADLNLKAGALSCSGAVAAASDGQKLLAAIHFNGVSHDKLTAAQTTQATTHASTLDRYNNALLC